jgi:hypothetical protein
MMTLDMVRVSDRAIDAHIHVSTEVCSIVLVPGLWPSAVKCDCRKVVNVS